jgi:hypothetical protein
VISKIRGLGRRASVLKAAGATALLEARSMNYHKRLVMTGLGVLILAVAIYLSF